MKSTINFLTIPIIVALLLIGCVNVEPKNKYITAYEYFSPTVTSKFMLDDTIKITTERVAIFNDKCQRRDTIIQHVETYPTPYIITTFTKERKTTRWYCVTEKFFHELPIGAEFNNNDGREIKNPINCK